MKHRNNHGNDDDIALGNYWSVLYGKKSKAKKRKAIKKETHKRERQEKYEA